VRAAHDCSEGGLAVALAEMAQAGEIGIALHEIAERLCGGDCGTPLRGRLRNAPAGEIVLFSESNGRIVVEVAPDHAAAFEAVMRDLPCTLIGETREQPGITLASGDTLLD
jgi:phosphoribosylformylglycinamidine synthase